MPENRNFTITTPVGGANTSIEPSVADVRNTVFKSKNVISGKRKGRATFGSRDEFATVTDSALIDDTTLLVIGDSQIIVGDTELCFYISSGTVDIEEPDIYYRDRKVVKNGNSVKFSRVHDYDDFDFGATMESSSRAALRQVGESPEISGDVTAVVPYADRICWIFTSRSLYLLTGDPVDGRITQKSYDVGTYSQFSADVTDVGEVYFLCRDGLVSCGIEGRVNEISELTIPGHLYDERNAMVAYDDLRQFIYARSYDEFWCLDVRPKVFWEYGVSSMPVRRTKSSSGELHLVCEDGAVRKFSVEEPCESSWHVVFGPYATAQGFRDGLVRELQGFIGDGVCNVQVITSKTSHSCLVDAEAFVGTTGEYSLSEGYNPPYRPRKRGAWFCLVLQGDDDFEMERLTVMSTMKGRLR